jgi:hypothetical protein
MKQWIAIALVTLAAGLGVFTIINVSADSTMVGCHLGAPGC